MAEENRRQSQLEIPVELKSGEYTPQEAILISIAISLKRIADRLDHDLGAIPNKLQDIAMALGRLKQ